MFRPVETKNQIAAATTRHPAVRKAVGIDAVSLNQPNAGGPSTNPTSPAERYKPIPNPRSLSGNNSATKAAGAGPAVPVPRVRITLPITNHNGVPLDAMTNVPSAAATPENRITGAQPTFSVAHVAGQRVNKVMTPVMVNTNPISPGPHARTPSAWRGTNVARVPARVMKIVPVTKAIAINGPLQTMRLTSVAERADCSESVLGRNVSGRRNAA